LQIAGFLNSDVVDDEAMTSAFCCSDRMSLINISLQYTFCHLPVSAIPEHTCVCDIRLVCMKLRVLLNSRN